MSEYEYKQPKYLEYEEYVKAKKREKELYRLLEPWADSEKLKPGAPEGYDELLIEFQELARNVYYTEFIDG